MKLLVTRRNGETELLDLQPPLRFVDGEYMWRIVDGRGMEYFFNSRLDAGTFDGWGCAVSSNAEAEQLLKQAVESKSPPKAKLQ